MSPVLVALALSVATVSTSKLGVFVGADISTTPNPIIAVCPALAVFPFDVTDPNAAAAVKPSVTAYTSTCPAGRVILRLGGAGFDVTSALLQYPQLPSMIQATGLRGVIDAVEIPFSSTGDPTQVAASWAQLAQLLSPLYLTLLGAGPITSPTAFCPVVSAVTNQGFSGFGIAFQAVSAMTYSASDDAFVFAQVRVACGLAGVPLIGYPMFLTELSPMTGVWDQGGMTWLAWFDQQLALDPQLRAAALFQLGASPDITNIASLLIAYFPNPSLTDGGGIDGGGGGSSSGVLPPRYGTAGGTLSPPGEGCSTAGPGFVGLAVIPALLLLRRRTRRRQGRGSTGAPRLRA